MCVFRRMILYLKRLTQLMFFFLQLMILVMIRIRFLDAGVKNNASFCIKSVLPAEKSHYYFTLLYNIKKIHVLYITGLRTSIEQKKNKNKIVLHNKTHYLLFCAVSFLLLSFTIIVHRGWRLPLSSFFSKGDGVICCCFLSIINQAQKSKGKNNI